MIDKIIGGTSVPPLSYSSMVNILTCEQKYAWDKVMGLSPDTDYEQAKDALDLGSVFHKCLEVCEHDLNGFKYGTITDIMSEKDEDTGELLYGSLDPDWHGPLILAMLRRYKNMHESVGLRVASIEMELLYKEDFKGFIDVVLESDKGYWITDIKTTADASRYIVAEKLRNDRQLNLYIHFYNKVMKPAKPILGCRYRAIKKCTKATKRRKNESLKQFSERIYGQIMAHEYVIPVEQMDPDGAYETFKKVRQRQRGLHKNSSPIRNFKACNDFNRPCEFWSKCHGRNFTDDDQGYSVEIY